MVSVRHESAQDVLKKLHWSGVAVGRRQADVSGYVMGRGEKSDWDGATAADAAIGLRLTAAMMLSGPRLMAGR